VCSKQATTQFGQGEGRREVGEGICKSVITQSKRIQEQVPIIKLPNPSYPLDVDPMIRIEISIVCTARLVYT